MVNLINRYDEKIKNNKEEINYRNGLMVGITMIGVLFLYISGLIISFFQEGYYNMRGPYIGIVIGFIVATIIYHLVRKKHILIFSYVFLVLFCGFLVYTSVFVQSDRICVPILFFLFLSPILVLDYEWRIGGLTLLFSIIYIILLCFFKEKSLVFDEIFNVLSTISLGLVLNHYFTGIMVENIDLKRTAQIAAHTDYLTGIPNRLSLYQVLKTKEFSSVRYILMIDIDDFKLYNDTYGHLMGDECLKTVINTFNEIIKKYHSMTVYRYGGEEFVILVRDNSVPIGQIAEELRTSIENLKMENKKSTLGIVTISIGVSEVSKDFESDALLSKADYALYTAKRSGKNRVNFKE